jgi:transposase-like protein
VFSVSLRDVALLLAERGIIVSYETVRRWCKKFGQTFANRLRRRRPRPGDKWHLDEDKSFPIGVAFGSRVMICDNLALLGEHVVKRRHTAKAKFALPSLMSEIIAPLQQQRLAQSDTFLRYKALPLTAETVDHAIMSMYRQGVIGVQSIA